MKTILALLLILGGGRGASAAQLRRDEVPAPLAPWVDWVLKGNEEKLCPFFNGGDAASCVWPGALALAVGEKTGRFEQSIRLYAPGWAALPGDGAHWPQDVRADGQPAAVVARAGLPALRLKPGLHSVSGAFAWDSAPEVLRVPPETGLVSLALLASPCRSRPATRAAGSGCRSGPRPRRPKRRAWTSRSIAM